MWTYMFANKRMNRADINALDVKTRHIKDEIIDQERSAESLRTDFCRLLLVVEALKRTMIARGLITEKEFEEMLLSLDLEDGVKDGLRTQKKVRHFHCMHCGKRNRNRAYCWHCGQPLHAEKATARNRICPGCEQVIPVRLTACQYCGASLKEPRRRTAKS